jgi:hypothetical protein
MLLSVFIIPRAVLRYTFQYSSLSLSVVSLRTYILAAVIRWTYRLLNESQLEALQSALSAKDVKKVLAKPEMALYSTRVLIPVKGQGFEAFWVAKDPTLSEPGARVILWLHGTSAGIDNFRWRLWHWERSYVLSVAVTSLRDVAAS